MSANVYSIEEAEIINNRYTPNGEKEIIRYMDFSSFMYLITFKKLYLKNVKKYEDKYEGKMPEGFYKNWKDDYIESHKNMMSVLDEHRHIYTSCWNKYEEIESYAMWRIYTDINAGIAIKSTVDKLKASLNDSSMRIYEVNYLNSYESKDEDVEIPFYIMENGGFFRVKEACKLAAYKYEEEIRAIKISGDNQDGLELWVDTNELIDEIYISPYASEWYINLVEETLAQSKYGLVGKKINKSKIVI